MVYVLHNVQPFIYLNIFDLPRFHNFLCYLSVDVLEDFKKYVCTDRDKIDTVGNIYFFVEHHRKYARCFIVPDTRHYIHARYRYWTLEENASTLSCVFW